MSQHQHEPDPQFLDALEWELNSALRRQQSLEIASGITPDRMGRTLLVALLLMAFSLAFGAGGTYAVVRAIEQPRQALNLDRERLHLELAQVRVDEIAGALNQLQADKEAADGQVLLRARERLAEADEQVRLHRLRFEEVSRTGLAPSDELSAPLVGERDFVTDRLAVRHRMMSGEIERLSENARLLDDHGEANEVDEIKRLRAVERLRLAQIRLEGLERLIELRESFTTGDVDALQVERDGLLARAHTERRIAGEQIRTARAINDHKRRQATNGRLAPASVPITDSIDIRGLELQRQAAEETIKHLESRTNGEP